MPCEWLAYLHTSNHTYPMVITIYSSFVAALLSSIILLVALIISFKSFSDREKSSPFECGFDPKSTARLPFSLRFFLLAVLFLVFDIEIVLLLPLPFLSNHSPLILLIAPITIFLIILIIGLFHEWNEGSLDWSQ